METRFGWEARRWGLFESGQHGFFGDTERPVCGQNGHDPPFNQVIGTPRKLVCISRPRRFSESFAAQMLSVYYDKTCGSSGLFDGLAISEDASYTEHLNRYDVICLDMAGAMGKTGLPDLVPFQKLTNRWGGV